MRISVLIPSFNHATFVTEAIDSALISPCNDLEVIVVDDGSTDDTRRHLEAFRGNGRVKVFTQDNRGAHAALNRAMDLASGDLFFILNSDDAYALDRVPRLEQELRERPDAAVAASWIQIVDGDGVEIGVKKGWRNLPPWPPPSKGPYLSDFGEPALALLESNYISTTSNLAFHSTLATEHGLRFQPLRYAHDWDFILSASHRGAIALVDEPLLKYRIHGANTILEGAHDADGLMRFEIMWVVARHAYRVLSSASSGKSEWAELFERFWNSAPAFECGAVLERLLLLRGSSSTPPAAYDALLDPTNPFRKSSIEVLGRA